MQTLAFEVATTFVDDAAALAIGAGRIIIKILTAPICDVAGVLPRRRAVRRAWADRQAARCQRWCRRPWLDRLFPLRALSRLT